MVPAREIDELLGRAEAAARALRAPAIAVGLKREMAERAMGRPATEVYDVESEFLQAGSSRGR